MNGDLTDGYLVGATCGDDLRNGVAESRCKPRTVQLRQLAR
jgi:hypothetical protein